MKKGPRSSYRLQNLVQFLSRSDSDFAEIRRVLLINKSDQQQLDVLNEFRLAIERGLLHLPLDSPDDILLTRSPKIHPPRW